MTSLGTRVNVEEAFREFRSRLELDPTYDQLVQQRHHAIRTLLENNLTWCQTKLIGSMQRRTRIDPLRGLDGFDIDIIVQLGTFNQFLPWGVTTSQALQSVENATASTHRYSSATPDAPTITFTYSDGMKIELVPAYADGTRVQTHPHNAFWIPGDSFWRSADYDYDASHITQRNAEANDLLVPAIKMLKAWRRQKLDGVLRSYHLEVMAAATVPAIVAQWRGQSYSWGELIWAFFKIAETESQIPGTFSEPADNYLSMADRGAVAVELALAANLAELALRAPQSQALEIWSGLFGKPFPGA